MFKSHSMIWIWKLTLLKMWNGSSHWKLRKFFILLRTVQLHTLNFFSITQVCYFVSLPCFRYSRVIIYFLGLVADSNQLKYRFPNIWKQFWQMALKKAQLSKFTVRLSTYLNFWSLVIHLFIVWSWHDLCSLLAMQISPINIKDWPWCSFFEKSLVHLSL